MVTIMFCQRFYMQSFCLEDMNIQYKLLLTSNQFW